MLFFYVNFSNGGSSAILPILLMLAVPLLNGGLAFFMEMVLNLLGLSIFEDEDTTVRANRRTTTASHTAHRHAQASRHADDLVWQPSLTFDILRGIIFTIAGFVFFRAAMYVRHGNPWPEALRRAMRRGAGVRHGGQAQQARRPRVTVEQVTAALQQLPTELHVTETQLEKMSVHELKERLQARGVDCSQFLEKRELLDQMRCGGSSATTCSICCDDFEADDAVRVLRCQHRYHVDCIDKWLLSCTDYTRPPACPLCNAELIKPVAEPGATAGRPAAATAAAASPASSSA